MEKSYFNLVKELLHSGEVESALKALHQAMEKGDGEACAFLGAIYMEGHYVKQDIPRAKAYFAQGAQLGNQACAENVDMPVIPIDKHGAIKPTKQNIRTLFRIAKHGMVEPLLMLGAGVDVFPVFLRDHLEEIEQLFLNAIDRYPKRHALRMTLVSLLQQLRKDNLWIPTALSVLGPMVADGEERAAMLFLDLAMLKPTTQGLRKQIKPALELIKHSMPDGYYVFLGYACLVDLDGPAAFAAFTEGVEQGHKLAALGQAYCYVHGIGTKRDYAEAQRLLEPIKDVHFMAYLCLARIAMLNDPEHPQIAQAMGYLDAAEDQGFELFREEVCIWLLWCKRRGIELIPKWQDRLMELLDEGLRYGSGLLPLLPLDDVGPLSEAAQGVLRKAGSLSSDLSVSPVGLYRCLYDRLVEQDDQAITSLKLLVERAALDWDVRSELALTGAFTCASDMGRRDWFLQKAKRLSQGLYDSLIQRCAVFFALYDAYGSEEIESLVERFLSDYPSQAGDPVAEYTYAWCVQHGLLDQVDSRVCVDHIQGIKDSPFPYFWQLCSELLNGLEDADEERIRLAERERQYMKGIYFTRVLCGCTAIPFLMFG
ncbi:MAG: hypothetical protein ACI3ZY_00095 [Parabacteroides sp.]